MKFGKIFIYGAGRLGTALYHYCQDVHGGATFAFIETKPSNKFTADGVPVLSPEEACRGAGHALVFLAIGDAVARRLARLKLLSLHVPAEKIIDAADFVHANGLVHDRANSGYCILCGDYVKDFLSGGAVTGGIFTRRHVIGGGWRKNYQCPHCGGVDRERWQVWVLSKYTGIFTEPCRVLHFAPEPHLSHFIAANPECDYYTGDIVKGRAMHRTDILDIQYKDGTFDYVIMNHVLEHIMDMETAMAEVKRVLKPDGKLVLSFPICMDMDTLELPDITTPEDRLEHYGQEDHVRLFGRDYLQYVESFGLNANVYTPKEYCTEEEIERYGFIEDDVLMICEKRIEGVSDE